MQLMPSIGAKACGHGKFSVRDYLGTFNPSLKPQFYSRNYVANSSGSVRGLGRLVFSRPSDALAIASWGV